jgi:hypothetical protein
MVVFISQTQNECCGYPKTRRHIAEMLQGVSTLIFDPLTFFIIFTVKMFFNPLALEMDI